MAKNASFESSEEEILTQLRPGTVSNHCPTGIHTPHHGRVSTFERDDASSLFSNSES